MKQLTLQVVEPEAMRVDIRDVEWGQGNCGRLVNILLRERIKTLGDLTQYTEQDLIRIKGVGKHTVWEIRDTLGTYSLKLKPRRERK